MSLKIKVLLTKYFTNSINAVELKDLASVLEKKENRKVFNAYVKLNFAINTVMDNYSADKVKEALMTKIKADKKVVNKLKLKQIFKYAAIVIFCLGLGYVYHMEISNNLDTSQITLNENQVMLKLSDGRINNLSDIKENPAVFKKQPFQLADNRLVYNAGYSENESKLKYNTLIVPYGKRFRVVLADGTRVDLNAGSSLKYPVDFMIGKNREVFLQGEAFFDVAKDENHPFIVNAEELNIRVLGTKFNVSAYQEDLNINTVLVEGSVGLFKKGESFSAENSSLLEPGFKGAYHKTKQDMSLEEVNTSIYTGWVDGKMIFNHMYFKDILKTLERHYNVSITNNNKELAEETFTATFDTETIEEVLYLFNKSFNINYKIMNNKILIN